jgi:hypothetical protein
MIYSSMQLHGNNSLPFTLREICFTKIQERNSQDIIGIELLAIAIGIVYNTP